MLVLDQLKKGDQPLQLVALGMLAGLLILLGGVWRVQVMNAKKYQESQRNQSYRTVRLSAIRGKILDRNGVALAENRPSYGIYLYLEELREKFKAEYRRARGEVLAAQAAGAKRESWWQVVLSRLRLVKSTVTKSGLTRQEADAMGRRSRYVVASNVTFQVSQYLTPALVLSEPAFQKHYSEQLALPMPVLDNLTPRQIARFADRSTGFPGVELEFQPQRHYPNGALAAHLMGYLRRERFEDEDQDIAYNYQLPDFRGRAGLEAAFDAELRGKPGVKSMLVNNLGYREEETIWVAPEPGLNVVLTLDLGIQKAAEASMAMAGAEICGALVVMDVRNGDILGLVSAPGFDPNRFMTPISRKEWEEKYNDPDQTPTFNRATYGAYPPGSIFKIITALACLEAGMDPNEVLYSPGYFQFENRRSRPIDDTAPPGGYDFMRAFKRSSNNYFIRQALRARAERLIEMGQRFGLGMKTGVPVYGEVGGDFPTLDDAKKPGFEHNTALMSIGQGPIAVTPLQMAVMTSAIANNGKVFKPRIVMRTETQAGDSPRVVSDYPSGQLYGSLGVRDDHLKLLREAMREDVKDHVEGTGKLADVPGMEVCGKTGTAEVKSGGYLLKKVTWFVSFAPLHQPRYAVVVMVDRGGSGGKTCAPIAKRVYEAIQRGERGHSGANIRVAMADSGGVGE